MCISPLSVSFFSFVLCLFFIKLSLLKHLSTDALEKGNDRSVDITTFKFGKHGRFAAFL